MSTIATVLLVVLLVALFNPELTNQIRAALTRTTGAQPGQSPATKLFFGFSGAIAPDLALLSGFVGDIVAGKYRYSMTSIVAIIAVILNKLIWGRGEVATQLAAAGQAVQQSFSGGPAAAAVVTPAQQSTGEAAAATALNVLSGSIPAVGFAGAAGTGGTAAASGSGAAAASAGTGGTGATTGGTAAASKSTPRRSTGRPTPSVRYPRSVSEMGSSVQSALRGAQTRQSSPRVRFTTLRGPPGPGTVTQSGRNVKLSRTNVAGRALSGGAREGLEEVDIEQSGGARVPADFNPCTIRGLGFLDTQNSPMGVAALVTVFFIYFLDMSVNSKRTPGEIAGNFVFGMFVLALNIGSYIFFECYGGNTGSVLTASVKAASVGVLVGGFAFLMYNYTTDYSKQWLPLDPSPASTAGGGSSSSSGTTPGTEQPCPPTSDGRPQHRQNGVCVPLTGASQSQCGGPNDDGQFVCDAYVNGKRISTSVVDGST